MIYRAAAKIVNSLMRYFFIEHPKMIGDAAILKGSDTRQIKNVLRLRPGDKIGLFDGKGMEYEAGIVAISAKGVEVEITRKFRSNSEADIDITVAQAYLKEPKMDGLVRQLTELGVKKWIPFFAQRSIPKPDAARLAARGHRWAKITKEALKQSKRGRVMEISRPVSFEEIPALAYGCHLKIVFWENETKPLCSADAQSADDIQRIFVMLGPEGGFTASEIERVIARGFKSASMGPRILRTETATVAAVTLVQYLFGDMGKKILTKI